MKYQKREICKFVILTYFDMRLKIDKKYFNDQYDYRIILPFKSFFDIAITEAQYQELKEDLKVFEDYPLRFNDQKIEVILLYKW